MAVSAHSDKVLSFSAKAQQVDMRSGSRQPAGSYTYQGDELISTWHAHDLHQLEYAFHGTVEVETATAHFLLPPQQAAWIPSGVDHRTTIRTTVRTISVFFESNLVPDPGGRVRIVAVPPVLREMMIYSGRWPIGRPHSDAIADAYFIALGRLVSEALDSEAPLFLPTSRDPVLSVALTWTRQNLDTATMGEVAHRVGLSERSLRRRFEAGLGMSWRNYVIQARVLQARALLAEQGPSVLQVANAVGFESLSSFNRAFRARTGVTPSAYRRQKDRHR
jgi:AraC-like DNA-binding protein